MKEGNNRGGLTWAQLDVSPQAEALTKCRGLNLNQSYRTEGRMDILSVMTF